jgi:hypothetical protein
MTGALYFSPVGDELGTRLRADIAAALEAEGPRGGRSDFSRGTCVSHAVVTGWQAAERAGEPDVYLRWRSAVLAWHETVEASLATELLRIEAEADSPLEMTVLTRRARDQAWRQAVASTMASTGDMPAEIRVMAMNMGLARTCEIDVSNRVFITAFLERHDWPRISEYGEAVDHAVWLMLQHASPELQARWLPVLAELVALGETRPANYAMLHDRVMTHAGQPQRFGSQFVCNAEGRYEMYDVEDPAGLDERRLEMGLSTVAENAARFERLSCDPG